MLRPSRRILNIEDEFSKFVGFKGDNYIDLSVGIPGFDTPNFIKEAAYKSLKNGRTAYISTKGDEDLRELIADMYSEKYGVDCKKENVVITHGAKGAIFALMQCYLNEGDEVLVQDPGWLSYTEIAKLANAIPKPLKALDGKNMADDAEEKIGEKTRMIIFSTPSNPTGEVYKEKTLRRISELGEDNNIMIISDEPYSEIIFNGKRHISLGRFGLGNNVIVNSFSKTYAMSGWRIGYIIAEKEITDTIAKFLLHQVTCVAPFIQDAAREAILRGDEIVKERCKIYERRMKLFLRNLTKELKGKKPEGTFYYFPSLEKLGVTAKEFTRKLAEKKVLAVPGYLFGIYGQNHIRFSFAKPEEDLIEGASRINEAVEEVISYM